MLAHEEKLYVYRDNNILKNYQKIKVQIQNCEKIECFTISNYQN